MSLVVCVRPGRQRLYADGPSCPPAEPCQTINQISERLIDAADDCRPRLSLSSPLNSHSFCRDENKHKRMVGILKKMGKHSYHFFFLRRPKLKLRCFPQLSKGGNSWAAVPHVHFREFFIQVWSPKAEISNKVAYKYCSASPNRLWETSGPSFKLIHPFVELTFLRQS